jgi:hypothetical protein
MRTSNKNPDDFEYLSELGFEKLKLNEMDVDDIHQRIERRSGNSFSGKYLIAIILIVGILATISWIVTNKSAKPEDKIVSSQTENISPSEQKVIVPSANDTVFPVLKVKTSHPVYPGEHFTQENTDLHFDAEMSAEILPSKQITSIEAKSAPSKNIIAMLPNASVIYIYDLKVTDFQKLYFTRVEPFSIRNGGIRAEYENIHGYNSSKGIKEPVYTADQVLKDGLAAFDKTKYSNAISCFSLLLEINKNDVNALFYSALSQYHLEKYSISVSLLDRVLQNDNNVFHQEAEWYKALALLKLNKIEEGKELLLKINNQQGFYSERAGEKLKEIQ